MPLNQDYSRICYFKMKVTAKMLTEEIRTLRTDHKRAMMRIPHVLSKHLQDWIFSLEDGRYMRSVESDSKFEMGLDLRSTTERHNSRYNIDTVTLNPEFDVYRAKPQLINRQEHNQTIPAVYHLVVQE